MTTCPRPTMITILLSHLFADASTSLVPEPTTVALLALGAIALLACRRRPPRP